jgi:hypothetical protein
MTPVIAAASFLVAMVASRLPSRGDLAIGLAVATQLL